ncbi:MAG: tetratricopeptide repeat protein, partial [Planctomycetaceae bacterium]|nr:tetratricopeptide repeat protein [Planctomycetaceae bacterium]
TAFTQATELNPKLDSAWNGLGWARLNAGKTDEAVLAFQKCVELIPAHAAALNGLGQAFLSQRKYVEAEEHLKDAAEGGASAAWYGLMRIYMLQGKYEDARVWAEKVAAANPQDPICQQVLAAAQAGELPSDLRQLIEPPEPMSADTQNAWQLFNSGRMTEAREVFKQALTADPDDISAHNGLGFVLLNTGDHADARPHFKACLESQPQHWGAMNGLARCLKAEGDIDGAVKLWQQMVDGVPGINAGHAGLADVYFERREYDKAVQFYEQLAAASAGDSFYAARLKTAREELEKSKSSN